MILADKIIDLRKKSGWSQEELAELLDVSRQSISKWEGAQSMPDMNRILKMSEVFGVSTDYLLKDEIEAPEYIESAPDAPELRSVSMEEAADFLSIKKQTSGRVALGVMLCILSPVLLIALAATREYGKINMAESTAAGLGLVVLFALIGCAVATFIRSGQKTAPYDFLEEENIDTAYGVRGLVNERREQFRAKFHREITIGIVLCVVSAVPLFLSLLFFGEDDFAHAISVAALLCLVAIGVFLIVRACIIWDSFQMLLEEGDYSREEKAYQKKTGWISGVYWLSAVAIFLISGFVTNDWDKTWIVWPIAGIAFAILMTVIRNIRKK